MISVWTPWIVYLGKGAIGFVISISLVWGLYLLMKLSIVCVTCSKYLSYPSLTKIIFTFSKERSVIQSYLPSIISSSFFFLSLLFACGPSPTFRRNLIFYVLLIRWMDLLKIQWGRKLPQYLASGMIACITLVVMLISSQKISLRRMQPCYGKGLSHHLISLGTIWHHLPSHWMSLPQDWRYNDVLDHNSI